MNKLTCPSEIGVGEMLKLDRLEKITVAGSCTTITYTYTSNLGGGIITGDRSLIQHGYYRKKEVAKMKYDDFLELMKYRRSIRSFKPDPIPDEYITKILDVAHYAMSGANSQPWEFIVIKDKEIRKRIIEAFVSTRVRVWSLEQQRIPEYRHPAYNYSPEEKEKALARMGSWGVAPVYIVVLYDPRKQFGTVMAGRMILNRTLYNTMGHISMVIHQAAASLGLGSQRVDAGTQTAFREILGYPEPLEIDCIVPIGYRNIEPGPPQRFPLEELVHYDEYDMNKYLRDEDFLKFMERIRKLGRPGYRPVTEE
jgi:nitroreductase